MKNILQILIAALLLHANALCLSAKELKADDSLISTIDKRVAEIEDFRKHHKQNQKIFIVKLINDYDFGLVEVEDDSHSIETQVSYYMLFDDHGRLLSHSEVPTHSSGDLYAERTHYFDEKGNTIMFKNYSWDYTSLCTFLLHVTSRYYFDYNFNLIKKSIQFTDRDNKPIADTSKCEGYGLPEMERMNQKLMRSNYTKLQQRISRDLVEFKKQRIEYLEYQKEQYVRNAKFEEGYSRYVRREHIKNNIRTSLYILSALSAALAVILIILKKIRSNKAQGS